ncbi:substrate-binding domain-containing protein [Oscillatoria sp. CS-180]|uniref:substrate-binding domain-containing protein n=1 Tax=Oscillatoria sp. CS-180 TaxID=3021720 RepID=UPI00232B8022|nr:substrate-binding domain-containing protein [Oscillatoria sp. CS-180]MDB9526096.1 substrate-binding domain-containing protein [Oscillatoria sp. CS-180]
MKKTSRMVVSTAIAIGSLGLAYAPLPGVSQTLTVVSGSELQEPLAVLEERFEAANPNIDLKIEIQGSQDMVNNYVDDQNDFTPTVLIPANGQLLDELAQRWTAQSGEDPFYDAPQPVAKTMLVAVVWPERGQALFPDNQFRWSRLEEAVSQGNWSDLGGNAEWGSFDFVTTDPERSNSGQLTLTLWSQAKLGSQSLTLANLNTSPIENLFGLVKQSVYQPPRSTDILLQEFIARGPNDADIAMVYESVALLRWDQAAQRQGKPYQIYYLDPTIETISTAAIARRDVSAAEARNGRQFIDFLLAPEQQAVFVEHGFRPANADVDLQANSNSPWQQGIPGVELQPSVETTQPPDREVVTEVIRLWQRSN